MFLVNSIKVGESLSQLFPSLKNRVPCFFVCVSQICQNLDLLLKCHFGFLKLIIYVQYLARWSIKASRIELIWFLITHSHIQVNKKKLQELYISWGSFSIAPILHLMGADFLCYAVSCEARYNHFNEYHNIMRLLIMSFC